MAHIKITQMQDDPQNDGYVLITFRIDNTVKQFDKFVNAYRDGKRLDLQIARDS
jgi:hypothetical protein